MKIDLKNIAAVVFDFDGVVVNSEPFYEAAITDVFRENNIVIPTEDWENFKGMADKEFFPLMVSRYNFQGDTENLRNDMYNRMRKKLLALDYIEGFQTFYNDISRQYATGLVTSTTRNHIQWLADNTNIEDLFPQKITATDVTKTKPHPEPYLKMAELLDIAPQNIVVIEDSVNGLKSAQRAGMKTIALLTTFPREKVDFADEVAFNYSELMMMFGLNSSGFSS